MKHVLLPIDGSTRSLRTIDMVQQTYRPQDTEVTLLMVLPDQMHIDANLPGTGWPARPPRSWKPSPPCCPAGQSALNCCGAAPAGNCLYARERGFDALVMTRPS